MKDFSTPFVAEIYDPSIIVPRLSPFSSPYQVAYNYKGNAFLIDLSPMRPSTGEYGKVFDAILSGFSIGGAIASIVAKKRGKSKKLVALPLVGGALTTAIAGFALVYDYSYAEPIVVALSNDEANELKILKSEAPERFQELARITINQAQSNTERSRFKSIV